jgi:hypothetical protein
LGHIEIFGGFAIKIMNGKAQDRTEKPETIVRYVLGKPPGQV